MKFGKPFAAGVALAILCGAPASAGEVTGPITAYDVAIGRITLGNGKTFSIPSALISNATKIGSVVRVTFQEYGENDNEARVTNIVLVCNDPIGAFCLPPRELQ